MTVVLRVSKHLFELGYLHMYIHSLRAILKIFYLLRFGTQCTKMPFFPDRRWLKSLFLLFAYVTYGKNQKGMCIFCGKLPECIGYPSVRTGSGVWVKAWETCSDSRGVAITEPCPALLSLLLLLLSVCNFVIVSVIVNKELNEEK